MLSEFSEDLTNLHQKFGIISEVIVSVVDRVENLECRVSTLERKVNEWGSSQQNSGYADALRSAPVENNASERLSRLEYESSEEQRKDKLLHVQITHPSLDHGSANHCEHVKKFLTEKLRMSAREIDSNMIVFKLLDLIHLI